jgi:hypothetical protein
VKSKLKDAEDGGNDSEVTDGSQDGSTDLPMMQQAWDTTNLNL